jgi:hypothetical protein
MVMTMSRLPSSNRPGGGGVTDIAWALDGKYLAVATEQEFAGILPTAA